MNSAKQTDNIYLIIDQGNTLTKVALFINDSLQWLKSFNAFNEGDAEEINKAIRLSVHESNLSLNDFQNKALKGPSVNDQSLTGIHGIISSVSSDPLALTSHFKSVDWLLLDHNTPIPVTNKYLTPETLGKDRLAGVIAASRLYPGKDVLVIDAGTAITYDIITSHKEYIGGSISPGLGIRFKGLHNFTGRLPLYEATSFDELTGSDTQGSILSGVMNGARFEMDGFINEYKSKYQGLIAILTGGDAVYFDKKLKSDIFAQENLVINGLKLILQYNIEK